jgi:hypothetical protein
MKERKTKRHQSKIKWFTDIRSTLAKLEVTGKDNVRSSEMLKQCVVIYEKFLVSMM